MRAHPRIWLGGCSLLLLSSLAITQLSPLLLPQVHETVSQSERAVEEGQYQMALALMKGTLYSDGVTIGVEGDHTDRSDIVREAAQGWNKALEGDSPIRFVSMRENPQVIVKWVPQVPAEGSHTLGLIKMRKEFRWNTTRHEVGIKGTIYVATQPPGSPLSRSEQVDVVMHELGHLLGLDDCGDLGPLMGPLERGKPVGAPTPDEVAAVTGLRRMVRDKLSLVNLQLSRQSITAGRRQTPHEHRQASPQDHGKIAVVESQAK